MDISIIIAADNLIFAYLETVFDVETLRDFRFPPRGSWELRSSVLLRSE